MKMILAATAVFGVCLIGCSSTTRADAEPATPADSKKTTTTVSYAAEPNGRRPGPATAADPGVCIAYLAFMDVLSQKPVDTAKAQAALDDMSAHPAPGLTETFQDFVTAQRLLIRTGASGYEMTEADEKELDEANLEAVLEVGMWALEHCGPATTDPAAEQTLDFDDAVEVEFGAEPGAGSLSEQSPP